MPATCLKDIDIVILAGGLGTRIKNALGDTPKLLAPIDGTPFLEFVINRLKLFGARRLVLGLGHLAGAVVEYLEAHPPQEIAVVTKIESEPMVTAGAIRHVAGRIESDPVLIMNGDSFIDADLCGFLAAHEQSGAEASLLCAEIEDTTRYGRLQLSPQGRIEAFLEKDPALSGPGVINAGVYLFSGAMLKTIEAMDGPSLELDVFAALAPETLNAVPSTGTFIDIGTPDDLARAENVLRPFRPT
ncbi:MAG: sugar phosphate nucleotidyltransferase [Alphaproteobacteria bacterium]|nr:sugar phosphate nucleotidyltransferase [Alphaproteobacteria bacterium]